MRILSVKDLAKQRHQTKTFRRMLRFSKPYKSCPDQFSSHWRLFRYWPPKYSKNANPTLFANFWDKTRLNSRFWGRPFLVVPQRILEAGQGWICWIWRTTFSVLVSGSIVWSSSATFSVLVSKVEQKCESGSFRRNFFEARQGWICGIRRLTFPPLFSAKFRGRTRLNLRNLEDNFFGTGLLINFLVLFGVTTIFHELQIPLTFMKCCGTLITFVLFSFKWRHSQNWFANRWL